MMRVLERKQEHLETFVMEHVVFIVTQVCHPHILKFHKKYAIFRLKPTDIPAAQSRANRSQI